VIGRGDHSLSGNKREWSPRRVLLLDTETRQVEHEGGTVMPLRLWVLRLVRRDVGSRHAWRTRTWWGRRGADLVVALDEALTSGASHWLFAHNLGFDLATTRLPDHLAASGWEWTQGTVTGGSMWMQWRRDPHHLTLVDSFSHLPSSLERIGESLGVGKLPRPDDDADEQAWLDYCLRDVDILATAVCQLLDWWDHERLGNFAITGAQTGWNAWRHYGTRPVVHISADPRAREFARGAAHGGRRQVWRYGDLHDGPFAEVDMTLAHAHVCRDRRLPVALAGWRESVPLDDPVWRSPTLALVADCTIETDRPVYPVPTSAGVLYPVGRFTTRLAWPELDEARRRGELLAVGRALVVRLGCELQEWFDRLVYRLRARPPLDPPMGWLAMKGWSRTLVGKWAARSAQLVAEWEDEGSAFHVEHGFWTDPTISATTVSLGGRSRMYVRSGDADDAFPAVYAGVCSWQRLALRQLLEAIGADRVVHCNTDSVVARVPAGVPLTGDRDADLATLLRAWHVDPDVVAVLPPLVLKGVWPSLRIHTPDHLMLGEGAGQRRLVAGPPRGAVETEPWFFHGDVWPGMPKQLTIGAAEEFRIERRTFDLRGTLPLGWVAEGGWVRPPRMDLVDGANRVLPPPPSASERPQHQRLLALAAPQSRRQARSEPL
jgi:hypothetical protein